MNALDVYLSQALKHKIVAQPVVKSPEPAILKVNLKLFGPARDSRGRFIRKAV